MPHQPLAPIWMEMSGSERMQEYDRLTRAIDAGGEVEGEKIMRRMLRGIIVAKQDQLAPPFDIGDQLVAINNAKTVRCPYECSCFEKGWVATVRDLTYDSDHGWIFVHSSRSDYEFYKMSDFEKAEEPILTKTPT